MPSGRTSILVTEKLVRGVYAAVLTLRNPDDSVDEAAFARLLQFLLEREISGFALNGAIGEFCLTTPRHRGCHTGQTIVTKCRGHRDRAARILLPFRGKPSSPGVPILLSSVAALRKSRA